MTHPWQNSISLIQSITIIVKPTLRVSLLFFILFLVNNNGRRNQRGSKVNWSSIAHTKNRRCKLHQYFDDVNRLPVK